MHICVQVCGNSDGGLGSAVDGLSFSEHQAFRGKLLTHGGQIAGVQRARFTSAGHQFSKCVCDRTNQKMQSQISAGGDGGKGSERDKVRTRQTALTLSSVLCCIFGSRLNDRSVFVPNTRM